MNRLFDYRAFGRHLQEAFENWQQDEGMQLAAGLSYYAALSFFPLLLILIAGIGLLLQHTGWGQDAQRQILNFVGEQASPSLAQNVRVALEQVQSNAAIGGPVGLATLVVAAIGIFAQFEYAFDRVWNVEPPVQRSWISGLKQILRVRFRAFLMLIGVGGLVVVGFIAGLAVSAAASMSEGMLNLPVTFWAIVPFVVAVAFNWAMFTIIYRVLPKAPVPWSEAARGGLLASILWEVGRQVLAAYVIGGSYNAYGVVGSFIAIMLWVYYGSLVLFFGAEYVQAICADCARHGGQEEQPMSGG
jgi:membrane protein